MKRFASLSLAAEMIGAVLIALLLSNVAIFMLFTSERARDVRFIRFDLAEGRLATLAELLPNVSPERQAQYLFAASGRGERLEFGPTPIVAGNETRSVELEARFRRALVPLEPRDVRVAIRESELRRPGDLRPGSPPPRFGPPPGLPPAMAGPPPQFQPPISRLAGPRGPMRGSLIVRRFAIAVELPDGRWLNAQFALPRPVLATGAYVLSLSITTLALIAASTWMALRFARPLRRLAEASASLRPGEPVREIKVEGPSALKNVIRSFNAMSKRLMATLEGQRAMLAAIAHDLRTPITSLKLRLELLDDPDVKERMESSLDELQSVTEAAVDALKAEGTGETTRPVDLAALVDSLCADLSEMGLNVSSATSGPLNCRCRPHEIRRAVRNLIENAARYGAGARVSVARDGADLVVAVEDDGPGIPRTELEHVFEPFRRLEQSRNRETGGHGLGLTIARAIARGHGGDIVLVNRQEGGLSAVLRFPSA
jgi:signal transduction histidine kinase